MYTVDCLLCSFLPNCEKLLYFDFLTSCLHKEKKNLVPFIRTTQTYIVANEEKIGKLPLCMQQSSSINRINTDQVLN